MQNAILYLFKVRDKLNTLTEVLSVETANRRERHPGDSPQATSFENKRIVQKNRVDSAGGGLERNGNFSYTEKKILRKSERCHKSEPEEEKGDLWQKKRTKSTKTVYL